MLSPGRKEKFVMSLVLRRANSLGESKQAQNRLRA